MQLRTIQDIAEIDSSLSATAVHAAPIYDSRARQIGRVEAERCFNGSGRHAGGVEVNSVLTMEVGGANARPMNSWAFC